jgi:hypothetical protein
LAPGACCLHTFEAAAVKLDRGLVTLNAVQPPPFIFATKTWGIPDQ